MKLVFKVIIKEAQETKRHWSFLFIPVLSCCKSLQVSIPKDEYEAEKGGSIDLTCSWVPANPSLTDYVLTWEVFPEITGDPMVRREITALNTKYMFM